MVLLISVARSWPPHRKQRISTYPPPPPSPPQLEAISPSAATPMPAARSPWALRQDLMTHPSRAAGPATTVRFNRFRKRLLDKLEIQGGNVNG